MAEIINLSANNSNQPTGFLYEQNGLLEITADALADIRSNISKKTIMSMPIAQLATLGASVSSLLPAFRTVTSTTMVNAEGLYRLTNAGVGDALKVAKNGNFWGAFKTADGASKFAQLQTAGPLTSINTAVMPIDPATIMMAVALFSIEQQLGNIVDMEKKILNFLEVEKESEIEADVEMLGSMMTKYKVNWDNEHFITSNHKMVLDIQRTARKNLISYQRQISDVLNGKQFLVGQGKVHSVMNDMIKRFKYYRMSLFTFSLSSLVEIMLGGNFKEEYIAGIKDEIDQMSMTYRELYGKCSTYLEKISSASVETNILKGIGSATKAVGKVIGSIPVVKEGQVDEFLKDGGSKLRKNAYGMEREIISTFAQISSPDTRIFLKKMSELIKIYNHTEEIYFDKEQIYLVAG